MNMRSTRKHIVRTITLGFVGTTLAFAHPTDLGVGSLANLSEMRQEKTSAKAYLIFDKRGILTDTVLANAGLTD